MHRFNPKSLPACLVALFLTICGARAADLPVTVTIDPASSRAPISPYIYGSNQDFAGVPLTARRMGGNRMTGYNWENNASNAGSDYLYESDNYMTSIFGITGTQANSPGITLTYFHDQSIASGVPYSVVTLPMAGYVAKDKAGPVSPAEAPPSARWAQVVNTKGSAFSATPSTTDGFVYSDELLNFLIQKYGAANTAQGIKGYNLDNEPDLWSSTHSELHPVQPTCVELISKSVDLAKTVKRMDPAAETLGPVSYGFGGYYNFQSAPDWTTEMAKGGGHYRWFLDYYLDQMKQAATTGPRLLDVLDLHLYTEAVAGGVRVNSTSDWTNIDCNKGRMQAPRELWDPTFVENSWIQQYYASFLPFLPNIKQSITAYYPGTKLSFTEYCYGGESHVSGGIAEADTLGIFGKYGVYLATVWPLNSNTNYLGAAFNLYRNFDGAGAKFGDTTIAATDNDTINTSAYAAVSAAEPGKLHVVLLNKSYDSNAAVTFHISGSTVYHSGRVFAFDNASATITERAPITGITGNQFTYSLPPLTAAHIVLDSPAAARSAVRDFNGNGTSDLLWTNTTTGERYVWLMNSGAFSSSSYLGTIGTPWTVTTGDFNGDRTTDLLWTNTSTGERYIWLINGGAFSSSLYLGTIGNTWTVVTGDFNGDGTTDILWTNTSTGERYVWLMNGGAFGSSLYLGTIATSWTATPGDFNGDGTTDILWTNTSTGERYIWLMNGGAFVSSLYLGTIGTSWTVATGDFNGDGTTDLLWTNTSTGERYLWLMAGGAFSSSVYLGIIATNWDLAP